MKVSDPLIEAWLKTLRRHGDAVAILDETATPVRSFRQVEERARELSEALAEFEPRDVIGVQIGNHPDWPSILLACIRSGLVLLPLDRSMSDHERAAALKICRAAGLISSSGAENGAAAERAPVIRSLACAQRVNWVNRPCLLKLTSGTTAAPRAIRFRSQQLLADSIQICDTMEIDETDVNFGVIPVSHSYGFSNLLTPLLVRGVPLVLSADRVPRAIVHNL